MPWGKIIEDAPLIVEEEKWLYKFKGHTEQALVHELIERNELWHKRLTHVHYKAWSMERKEFSGFLEIQAKHKGICKGCKKGKNAKNAFPSSDRKAKGILEIVHSNVCGPMSSISLSGYGTMFHL